MPLPTPNDGEKRSKFMERCMLDLADKKEFKGDKQRAAVCYSQFEEAASNASLIVKGAWDEEDIFYYFHSSVNKS
jgi:hypothetical protein